MTYEECEMLSKRTKARRNRKVLVQTCARMAIQWGGWLVAGVNLLAHLL